MGSSTPFGTTAIDAAIDQALTAFPGVLGLYARNLITGEEVCHRADAVMPTASAIKVGIMGELYRQVAIGEIDLNRRLPLTATDHVGGTGVLKDLAPGLAPTVADLCNLMIVVSDNVATGMLVRLLGKDRINRSFVEWGIPATELVWEDDYVDPRRYAVSSARDLGRLMELIATDGLVSADACAAMRRHLSRQQKRDQIPRHLPTAVILPGCADPRPIVVMNKPGNDVGVRTDVAIVTGPNANFVLAALNKGGSETGPRLDRAGNVLNAHVAKIVFDAWVGASSV